uniref:Mediator of RNA polymerase II transcription subunit 24 n=1 Tax=Nomascus leucogenys TaxID=61853 RepID=A0A2I3GYM9_NOMLE
MKVVNLKQAILQAWKERWSDYQWAINMKKFFPKGATWDILNLADALLEQAMIGPSPNPLILSYLKYAISSQMVSYSSVLTAISKCEQPGPQARGHACVRLPQPSSSLTSEELSRHRVCVCVCIYIFCNM